MTPDLWIALALGLLTFLGTVGGGTFALLKWLVATMNAAYKAQIDVTLAAKDAENHLLRERLAWCEDRCPEDRP